ncbi:mRNA splicing factor [Striga asiatica]|uniref:mRNA splicing factor n=1 Tax=Striga asiatica TaxID=4170 RepID=A0A5A7QQK2_STRAF|nr:mRNA splicing factor [Striga asiatica]
MASSHSQARPIQEAPFMPTFRSKEEFDRYIRDLVQGAASQPFSIEFMCHCLNTDRLISSLLLTRGMEIKAPPFFRFLSFYGSWRVNGKSITIQVGTQGPHQQAGRKILKLASSLSHSKKEKDESQGLNRD